MPYAVGVIETLGMPTALEAADVLCKAAAVEFVRFDNLHAGLISVIVRGPTAAVQAALTAAVASLSAQGRAVAGHHMIPCPEGQIETTFPLQPGTLATEDPDWLID